jgi:flagellar assembly protein FliH
MQAAMQAVMPISAPANEAAIAEERAQARREVLDELAAAQAALGRDAQLLAAALARMAQPPAADVAALTAHLGQAVAHLAAARAGQAIDADAAPFIRRIRALAERITAGFADVTLCLHPDDMAAVQALLQGHCPPDLTELAQARLRPDPGLLRGDLRLQAKGVLLEDLITAMDRPATSEAKA